MSDTTNDDGKKAEIPIVTNGGTIEVTSPFFIPASDNPNTIFVSDLLRDGNFADWADEMTNALFANNK